MPSRLAYQSCSIRGNLDQNDLDELVTDILNTKAGDANVDGIVDDADVAALVENFGRDGAWSQGDFILNGKVDFADFLLLAAGYDT